MKTQEEIKKEMDHLMERSKLIDSGADGDIKEKNRIRKRMTFLKPVLNYLKSDPCEKFVKSELDKQKKLLSSLDSRFSPPDNVNSTTMSSLRKTFDAEYGIKKIKEHIRHLKFLLDKIEPHD